MNKIFTIILKSRLHLLILVMIASTNINAQQYNTLYWMQGIPQSSYSNPGLQPQAGFYLGLPGVSSNYFGLINSGFAVKDVLKKDASNFLYIDDEGLLSKLEDSNYLLGELQVDLFGLGFRSGNDYFSLNVTHKVNGRMGYPGDFMTLLFKGNDHFMQQNLPADLTGLGIDFMQYHEIGLGYSRKWTDELTAGLRAKALMGLASVNFKRSDLSLVTQPDTYALLLNSDFLVNKSFPMQLSPLDSLGKEGYPESDDIDPLEYALNRKNMGFAIDLGASYEINDYFTVAASMIDLGFINWKADVENFAMKGEFEFDGIEFNDFFKSEGNDDDYNPFEGLKDSILDVFDINETMNSYRTALTKKVFASVAFQPAKAHKFGLLGRGEFYKGDLYPSFTVSYNLQPIRHIGMSVSYSVIHWNYNNVGAGLHLNLGPLQIYTVVDNFLPALRPHTLQTTTVHFGLNIVTGYRSQKDVVKPIIRW